MDPQDFDRAAYTVQDVSVLPLIRAAAALGGLWITTNADRIEVGGDEGKIKLFRAFMAVVASY